MLVHSKLTQDTAEKSTGFGRDSFQGGCQESVISVILPYTTPYNIHAVATPQMPPMKMPNRLLTARKLVKVVQKLVPICRAVIQILKYCRQDRIVSSSRL